MRLSPFTPDRKIGVVYAVEGLHVDVALHDGTRLPDSFFGETIPKGELGSFTVIDVGGLAIFGRVLSVGTHASQADALSNPRPDWSVPTQARIQLLASLTLSGSSERGILRYPRVGDPVYAASNEAISAVLDSTQNKHSSHVPLGRLTVTEQVEVNVSLNHLFGRHLAIVGATGSGKSWTLAHLVESIQQRGGKTILIDATGEFHTLGELATHVAFGSADGEPDGTKVVAVPHRYMRESDLNAFLRPSGGAQLPKLRAAVRSLKLARRIQLDDRAGIPVPEGFCELLGNDGSIIKSGKRIRVFERALAHYSEKLQNPHAPFRFNLLPQQIQNECIYPTGYKNTEVFGGENANELGYVSSLISRIDDLLKTPEVIGIISPQKGTPNVYDELTTWYETSTASIFRISLRNLPFANNLREMVVNILGKQLLEAARQGKYQEYPLVVALDEAHQFFDVTVGDEYASTRLDAFDAIAKEGRKYGLTVCLATQRPSDLPVGVLSQVGMTIVHRLTDGRDRRHIEQASSELDHSATQLLPGLVPGEAILMGVDFPVPVSVKVQRPVNPPESEGPNYAHWHKPVT